MELDDLKDIWRHGQAFDRKQEAELVSMLKGSSRSIVSKLKRNVWLELLLTVVAGAVLLYYSFSIPDGALRWSFISFLVFFLAYTVYYIKKIDVLNRFSNGTGNIRSNLENLIRDLDTYLKFYNLSYKVLYPVYLILIFLFLIVDRGWEEFVSGLSEWRTIAYLISFFIVFLISSLWFTNWYLHKLYGRHLEKLKRLFNDLADDNYRSANE